MTMNVRFVQLRGFLVRTNPSPDTVSTSFSHVAARVILDMCNIKIFGMIILH